jgi:DnaJ family protein A protein 2
VVRKKQDVSIQIKKGTRNGHHFRLEGEADQAPNTIPGDIVFILKEESHPVFTRVGKLPFLN